MIEEGSALLPLPQGLCITAIEKEETALLIHVLSTRETACCPLCAAESDVVHSRYQRRLSDLPCAGQPVGLRLIVRKFFVRIRSVGGKSLLNAFPLSSSHGHR